MSKQSLKDYRQWLAGDIGQFDHGVPIIGRCACCNRKPGMEHAHLNRFGSEDINPDCPIGPLAQCPQCRRMVCPDCLHEGDCCEMEGTQNVMDFSGPSHAKNAEGR
jgi:hypothetical protein